MLESEWLTSADPAAMLEVLFEGSGRELVRAAMFPVSPRKLRLFAVACARQAWGFLTDERARQVIEISEKYADSPTFQEELIFAHAYLGDNLIPSQLDYFCAWFTSRGSALPFVPAGSYPAGWPGLATQALFLRDIVGNPFRPVRQWNVIVNGIKKGQDVGYDLDDHCITAGVYSLAQAAYDNHDPSSGHLDLHRLLVLADALEEAGCPPEVETVEVTEHCNAFMFGCEELGAMDTCTHKVQSEKKVRAPHPVLAHLRLPGLHVRGCWALDLILGRSNS